MRNLLFSMSVILLGAGEAVPNGIQLLDPAARLTAVGVLGFIAIWVVTRTLPSMSRDWRDSVTAATKSTDKLTEALTQLRIHCATRPSQSSERE